MPQSDRFSRIPPQFSFLTLTKHKLALSVLALFLSGLFCLAQEQSPVPQGSTPDLRAIDKNNLLVPAGTRIALVLTHPIQSRYLHRGDDIYAETTSPATSGNQMLIPPGTFVQGKVDKLERTGGRVELHLQYASVTFSGGYVVPISAPLTLECDQGYAIKDPGKGRIVSAFALPAAASGLGALIGRAAGGNGTSINGMTFNPSGLKSTAIGSMVGLAVGGVVSFVILANSHNFFLDVGSPVEMVLQQPLSLERDRVAAAITRSNGRPPQAIAKRPQPSPTGTSTSPFDCPAGQAYCNGSCVDTAGFINDSNNCGRCGNRCSFSETCTGGFCGCAPGSEMCMGRCVSSATFISDSQNCGRCGNSCGVGESCFGGFCRKL